MCKRVEKKILPEYFNAVIEERKNFELRKDDNDIQPGDTIILKEWDGRRYTGRSAERCVTYVLRGCMEYGLNEGYCIIGWQKLDIEERKQELMPCPFCGKKAHALTTLKNNYLIICEMCSACGPDKETLDEAKKAWNNRAELQE